MCRPWAICTISLRRETKRVFRRGGGGFLEGLVGSSCTFGSPMPVEWVVKKPDKPHSVHGGLVLDVSPHWQTETDCDCERAVEGYTRIRTTPKATCILHDQ